MEDNRSICAGNMEEVLKDMEEWMEEKEVEYRIMIGGDFNAKTRREGGVIREEEEGGSGSEKRRIIG